MKSYLILFFQNGGNIPVDILCELFPKRQILHSYKLKDFAYDNSNFDENHPGGKLKGEISHYDWLVGWLYWGLTPL